ncbi:hypothetical protein [Pseudomonas sp. RIT-PI-AD]|uniref:hypothetical protein n=1 Tax=Pseudomonas sp. RIT-PI-AD TaxID=3035294 RepID=UPI0021DB1F06|nr:hypothetical protein [Pseudomonas sp. RIT-PI-AD]
MKLSDGFDARRLRPKGSCSWRWRFGAALAALFAGFGVLLTMAGAAMLLGHAPALGQLEATPANASVLLVLGVFSLWFGVLAWRLCRRRSRRRNDLCLAPHLMKKD